MSYYKTPLSLKIKALLSHLNVPCLLKPYWRSFMAELSHTSCSLKIHFSISISSIAEFSSIPTMAEGLLFSFIDQVCVAWYHSHCKICTRNFFGQEIHSEILNCPRISYCISSYLSWDCEEMLCSWDWASSPTFCLVTWKDYCLPA